VSTPEFAGQNTTATDRPTDRLTDPSTMPQTEWGMEKHHEFLKQRSRNQRKIKEPRMNTNGSE
jgi:hypothetical protein